MNWTLKEKEVAERQAEAQRELQRYCEEHPGSPTAVRRPRLLSRGRTWVAVLGVTLQDGVAGIGSSVRAALRSFDVQYTASMKQPRG